jgi:hypothetical protein
MPHFFRPTHERKRPGDDKWTPAKPKLSLQAVFNL